jgi:predicted XRE-type DNA-binding protein
MIKASSGNVVRDLRLKNADERQANIRLAVALNSIIDSRKLSQMQAGKCLGISQPKVSALRNYNLAGFSLERLMTLLTRLGCEIEIVIRMKSNSKRTGRVTVSTR